jgi:hypothetical protein
MSVEALRQGHVDEIQMTREWFDRSEETTEGFQLILTRDVISRHECESLDKTMENLRDS